jgi:hypothetical protein
LILSLSLPKTRALGNTLIVLDTPKIPGLTDEPVFTAEELATLKKLHPSTIRRLFLDEPGVIRLGHSGSRKRHQHFTLRIPRSVADRVFQRMTVGGKNGKA